MLRIMQRNAHGATLNGFVNELDRQAELGKSRLIYATPDPNFGVGVTRVTGEPRFSARSRFAKCDEAVFGLGQELAVGR